MDNKLSELKDALEFLETTEFDGEWDSALVGGENGKNYHAVINANDVVVRADDDSRHTSWLCDYLEAVSPVNIRAMLAELEDERASREQWQQNCTRTEERIAELESEMKVWESAATKHLARAEEVEQRIAELSELEAHNECLIKKNADLTQLNIKLGERLATPVRLKKVDSSNVPYAGDGFNAAVDYCADRVRAAGFTVEGDE
ncbi:TPA: hypothetical protein ACXM66_000287 [Serratia marcescens]